MRLRALLMVALVGLMSAGAVAQQPGQRGDGQRGRGAPGGGGFFFGGGGGGMSRLMLLGISEVQKELELADEQVKEIQKMQEELRARFRPPGGPGGPGGDGRRGRGNNERREGEPGGADRTSRPIPADWYFVQAQQQPDQGRGRGGFGQLTDEQRAEFEKRRLEQAREEKAKLADILLPHQVERLTQIFVQVAGVEALRDEDIAKELEMSDAQSAKVAEVRRANQEAMGEQMRELFGGGGGDRDAARAKMEEIRKANDAKVLAVLSPQQQKKFEEMKGKPFKMPEGAGRGGFGGRGGPGGPGGRGGPAGTPGRRGGGDNNRN